MDQPDSGTGTPTYLVMASISCLVAGIFCFTHVSGPYWHPDEPITKGVVSHLCQSGDFDANWRKADVPKDFKYDQYNFASYHMALSLYAGITGSTEIARLRLFSATCCFLTVCAVLLLGLNKANRDIAFPAALFSATTLILVQDAHYARPESFLTLLTVLLYKQQGCCGNHRRHRHSL